MSARSAGDGFAGDFQQYATSTIRTSGGSGVRRSWASVAHTFLSDPSAQRPMTKWHSPWPLAFRGVQCLSWRATSAPIYIAGRQDLSWDKHMLSYDLHPWLTLIYVSPAWGQGAICRSRPYQIVFLPRTGWEAGLSQLLSHQSKRSLRHRPTYSAHPLRWGVVPSLQSRSARPRYVAVWKEGHKPAQREAVQRMMCSNLLTPSRY